MRISDWSSDVCSSDLDRCKDRRIIFHFITYVAGSNGEDSEGQSQRTSNQKHACACQPLKGRSVDRHPVTQKEDAHQKEISLHIFGVDRKSVVKGKSVSVRVDFGGRRIIKKKNIYNK